MEIYTVNIVTYGDGFGSMDGLLILVVCFSVTTWIEEGIAQRELVVKVYLFFVPSQCPTEVLMLVLLLKIVMPKVVFVCRGNHEDTSVNKKYNFYSEIKTRFPKMFRKLFAKIADVYSVMPIACLISEQILCMHGGLSPRIQLVSEIAALRKPIYTNSKDDKHIDILWSDPKFDAWKFEVSGVIRINLSTEQFLEF
ncbi:phosphoprotein phosphatase 1 domain protein [Dictyocaulus viviparus]|uniref:protein-serine/threonine phosphatase n=1 Tax=Dictyocaulus viviparus TaxID=29172 RepID=A0A0D8XCH5_DICVI|nr:phosphoprotein phosphatase 1 domain protein [Dictyocaulus viviparus]